MDLSNIKPIEREIILKSWKDCHGFIQNKASFTPEIRALDPDGKLKISVVEEANKDALRIHVQSMDSNFAVLNQYGFYILPNESKNCVISTIFKESEFSNRYILFEDQSYEWESMTFDQVLNLAPAQADLQMGYVFDSMFEGTRVTIMPVVAQFDEMASVIREAKKSNNWETFRKELDHFDVNMQNGSGDSILQQIVVGAPLEILRTVLEKGCNPNIANHKYGRTAAYYANSIDVHKLLIEFGLNVNHQDANGTTAAEYQMGSKHVLETYINAGLDLSLKNVLERTIFFGSISQGQSDLVRLLIDKGVDVNAADKFGLTALFEAVQNNAHELIQILLASGATVDARTLKKIRLPIYENPPVLAEGSNVIDMIRTVEEWLGQFDASHYYITEYKDKFAKTKEILKSRFPDLPVESGSGKAEQPAANELHVSTDNFDKGQKEGGRSWIQRLFSK